MGAGGLLTFIRARWGSEEGQRQRQVGGFNPTTLRVEGGPRCSIRSSLDDSHFLTMRKASPQADGISSNPWPCRSAAVPGPLLYRCRRASSDILHSFAAVQRSPRRGLPPLQRLTFVPSLAGAPPTSPRYRLDLLPVSSGYHPGLPSVPLWGGGPRCACVRACEPHFGVSCCCTTASAAPFCSSTSLESFWWMGPFLSNCPNKPLGPAGRTLVGGLGGGAQPN